MRYVILALNLLFGVALVYVGFTKRDATAWDEVVIGGAFLTNVVYQIAAWPKGPNQALVRDERRSFDQ